jgi:membrane dipeptidase
MTTRRQTLQLMAGAAALAAVPTMARSAKKDLYERSMVIDALCFGMDWGEEVFTALNEAGYTGIIESLSREDLQTAIEQLVMWRRRVEENSDKLILALSASDFELAKETSRTAVLMNFQDATMLEGDEDNVEALHSMGMRCFQLTYNFRNLLGDGCLERTNAGLSDFGVKVVERMNQVGVMVDLSHCGRQTTLDGIAFSTKPVAMTHTICNTVRAHPRAKTDEAIKACADKGGVIGIAAIGYFVGPDPGGETTIEHYADHIEHAVSIAGHEHVGLSTDFPPQGISPWATREDWYEPRLKWFKPSYQVRWPPWIPELDSTNRFRNLLPVLEKRGWSEGNLELLLGQNWLRLLGETIG